MTRTYFIVHIEWIWLEWCHSAGSCSMATYCMHWMPFVCSHMFLIDHYPGGVLVCLRLLSCMTLHDNTRCHSNQISIPIEAGSCSCYHHDRRGPRCVEPTWLNQSSSIHEKKTQICKRWCYCRQANRHNMFDFFVRYR